MRVTFSRRDKAPANLISEAEVTFDADGPFHGMKLTGFVIWKGKDGTGRYVTFPARSSEGKFYDFLRSVDPDSPEGMAAIKRVKAWILDEYSKKHGAEGEMGGGSDGYSSSNKPLHVRVADALGMLEVEPTGPFGMWSYTYINSKTQFIKGQCPRFDTDWSVTGPLIDRFGLRVGPDHIGLIGKYTRWRADSRVEITSDHSHIVTEALGDTPLLAVCNLILMLHEAGKLK